MATKRPWYQATLGNQASLFAAAALLGVIYAGSTIVTPLYPLYQRAFDVSEVTVTLVYATYVIGNLGALFAFGRVSDQAGRRLVSLLVLAVAGASTVLFLFAVHPAMLFLGRAASGLAIGVGAATVTAWIADLYPADDKARASRLAAAVNLVGLAVGVVASGLFAQFAPWGLKVVEFDQTGPPPDGVQLVWLEAPSNPFLTMPDLEAAAAHPAPVVVDATASTPVHLRPLEHGADYVLHSATKYLAGHHDALLGVVVCKDEAAAAALRTFRTVTGIVAAPDPAFLLLRGLKTLEVRVQRQTASAAVIVERLRDHPAVETVRWPGFGGLLSFDVSDGDAARTVETSTELIVNATSLGGVTTVMESRYRWEGDRVPAGLLRLSVGLEDPEALWADLASALH